MKFKIFSGIFKEFPALVEAVVVLRNIDNTVNGEQILELLREEEKKKKEELKDIELAGSPAIESWRKAFRSFGSKPNKYVSSIEALLKRVQKGEKLPDINPLVNLYNYCSIKHLFPFGGESFAGVYGDLELKYCEGSEEFTPILSKENELSDKGEISWVDDKGVTCRKWNWRQCDRTKITEKTGEGYFIIDGLPPAGKKQVKKAAEEFIELAKEYLNADAEVYWLDKDNLEVEVNIDTKKLLKGGKKSSDQVSKKKVKKFEKQKPKPKPKSPFAGLLNKDLPQYQIRDIVWEAIKKCGYIKKQEIIIDHPREGRFGDFSTNVAMVLARKLKKSPAKVAAKIQGQIKDQMPGEEFLEEVSVTGGFINFKLKKEWLVKEAGKVLETKDQYEKLSKKQNLRVIVEFGQPNTHKMIHVGHLFSYILGESIARLTEAMGAEVFRANYQGDIGPHVAKCVWALKKFKPDIPETLRKKADILQLMYQKGSSAYKEDEEAKKEIEDINKKIYLKDPSVKEDWEETRSWSVSFYKEFEKTLGIHYDRYYFESETASIGKKIVEENIGKVFKKSQGAIIFEGSKYGLHDRVFITKRGTPTYEAKDMALQPLKYKEWPFDLMLITTASEQNEYFKVVFKALETWDKKFEGKLHHLGFGMVRLKSGKMSSRLGNIMTGVSLIEQAVKAVEKLVKDRGNLSKAEKDKIAKAVGIGAIKYSFLKNNPLQNLVFDFEQSINFDGNSGPYLQYTYARASSILREAKSAIYKLQPAADFNNEEMALLRTFYKFPEVVFSAGTNLAPNLLCAFLFDLAQKFNLFYKKHKVLQAGKEELKRSRLALTQITAQIIENGLNLLGIEVLERM